MQCCTVQPLSARNLAPCNIYCSVQFCAIISQNSPKIGCGKVALCDFGCNISRHFARKVALCDKKRSPHPWISSGSEWQDLRQCRKLRHQWQRLRQWWRDSCLVTGLLTWKVVKWRYFGQIDSGTRSDVNFTRFGRFWRTSRQNSRTDLHQMVVKDSICFKSVVIAVIWQRQKATAPVT